MDCGTYQSIRPECIIISIQPWLGCRKIDFSPLGSAMMTSQTSNVEIIDERFIIDPSIYIVLG